MKQNEQARMMREWADNCRREHRHIDAVLLRAGADAIEREAAREEKERPKVTLAEQIEAVVWASGHQPPMGVKLAAAYATLRRLEEEGGERVAEYFRTCGQFSGQAASARGFVDWLKSLGVEARKP